MKAFWDSRYAEPDFAYGTEPNIYFKEKIDQLTPGKLLLPAEGEGRNAVYAAQLGWQVEAFDISEEGKKKALQLATQKGMNINYHVGTFDQLHFEPGSFDCVALIYAHLHKDEQQQLHPKLIELLRPEGALILEGFSEAHLEFNSKDPRAGGPKDSAYLYTVEQLAKDFKNCELEQLEQQETTLKEGLYHQGASSVVRCFGTKR